MGNCVSGRGNGHSKDSEGFITFSCSSPKQEESMEGEGSRRERSEVMSVSKEEVIYMVKLEDKGSHSHTLCIFCTYKSGCKGVL